MNKTTGTPRHYRLHYVCERFDPDTGGWTQREGLEHLEAWDAKDALIQAELVLKNKPLERGHYIQELQPHVIDR